MAEEDPIKKWRRAGYKPVAVKETDGVTAVAPPSGIRPREYRAFASETSRMPMLRLKSSLVKKPEADIALPYACLNKVTSDGYGFVCGLIFSVPFPVGALIVRFRGEGMGPLVDAILRGVVTTVQIFDPDRFIVPQEGEFDVEADEWRGPCVVRDISITEQGAPLPNTTKH
jgi:hypothetical protein